MIIIMLNRTKNLNGRRVFWLGSKM